MRGQRFSTPEEAVDAFRMHVLDMQVPPSEWQKCFDNWFKCMQMCVKILMENILKNNKAIFDDEYLILFSNPEI